MVKRALTLFQLDRYWLELVFQLLRQTVADSIHFSRQYWFWQVRPLVASRHVIQAAIFARRIVQPDPAGQMSQRGRARPVRIILMPGHHSAVPRRLAKKLVVPEAHRTIEQLRRRNEKRRVPQEIVKARHHTPSSQRMK